jgi:hypothetical protein
MRRPHDERQHRKRTPLTPRSTVIRRDRIRRVTGTLYSLSCCTAPHFGIGQLADNLTTLPQRLSGRVMNGQSLGNDASNESFRCRQEVRRSKRHAQGGGIHSRPVLFRRPAAVATEELAGTTDEETARIGRGGENAI